MNFNKKVKFKLIKIYAYLFINVIYLYKINLSIKTINRGIKNYKLIKNSFFIIK